jgi:hypothetical protein
VMFPTLTLVELTRKRFENRIDEPSRIDSLNKRQLL